MRKSILLFLMGCLPAGLWAQEDFEAYRKGLLQGFDDFKQQVELDYAAFRAQTHSDYIEFLRQAWADFEAFSGDTIPFKHLPVPPVIFDGLSQPPLTPIDVPPIVLIPAPTPSPVPRPKPTPLAPVEPKPVEPDPVAPVTPVTPPPSPNQLAFSFFGTQMQVRQPLRAEYLTGDVSGLTIALAWGLLASGDNDAFVRDCLKLRDRYDLCDWAYLQMLDSVTTRVYPSSKNDATLLMAYAYACSGYKMRLATSGSRLYMLYASQHKIFELSYFTINGDRFYPYDCREQHLQICVAGFDQEQPLSLRIAELPHFKERPTATRVLTARDVPNFSVRSSVDLNQIHFFNTYPTSILGDDMMSRWAMYARTPMSETATETLYPQLRKLLDGKSTIASVEALLNFVQTAFVYEYDDKVWGGDRAFFADETLYYPYCDCEDRSILLSHLVRDLLGLRCALIYYPGHLATAVCFPEGQQPAGDAVSLNGRRFVICDPTYIGAPVGRTMPGMDNSTAKAVVL
jgi:hypothetical protein